MDQIVLDQMSSQIEDMASTHALAGSILQRMMKEIEREQARAAGQAELPPPVGGGESAASAEIAAQALAIADRITDAFHGENGGSIADIPDLAEELRALFADSAGARPDVVLRDEYELCPRPDAHPVAPTRVKMRIDGSGHQLTLNL